MHLVIAFLLLATISSCKPDFGKSVSDKGHRLYYLEPVTEAEAKNVLNWLHEINHNFSEPPVPFQLSKQGDKYIFKYAVNIEGSENEPGNIGYMQTFTQKLSEDALQKSAVEVHLMDVELKQTKKVITYP